ncbi:MAG: murein biosynthesis integral membrane protein MurJ [Rhodospirillales bacterium]|jgi:putative peptidoglycan lipid II flippase|nr:murein biosynthesis integral membrane protein MurJ [Rhodospirillales bacterium]
MNLLRAIAAIGSMTMVSRVFGFVRDILIAAVLGAGTSADCFFVAFRLPNLFRRLFAEGAFAAAFVPIFSGLLETDGREKAKQFADEAFSVLALALVIFTALFELAMPLVMYGLAPGFDQVEGKMELATELSRITFPYLLFISLVSLQSGVLNSLGRFAAAAAAPVLLNLTLIAAILTLPAFMETPGHALSWGVAAAGLIQLAWLAWHCRREGFPVRLMRPRLSPEVRLLGRRIVPVVFGASLYQINLLIGTILASLLSEGAVSYLYYADRVTQLPLGVVGVAVGTALLPMLSRSIKAGDAQGALHSQNRGLEFALLLTLPAAIALMVIAEPIISVLFERGRFDAAAALATAHALAAFSVGLPAYVLIRVLAPGFFAREDTVTPVRIAAVAMAANVALNVILMQFWAHVGIALASSLAAWINAGLLWIILRRRGFLVLDARLATRLPRILLAACLMAGVLAIGRSLLEGPLGGAMLMRIGALALLVTGGLAAFVAFARMTGAFSFSDIKTLRRDGSA